MVIKIVEQSPHIDWREELEHYELPITKYAYAPYFGVKAGETLHGCFHNLGEAMTEALKLQNTLGMCDIDASIEVVRLGKK